MTDLCKAARGRECQVRTTARGSGLNAVLIKSHLDYLNANDSAVMADMIVVIQELQAKVKALESQLTSFH